MNLTKPVEINSNVIPFHPDDEVIKNSKFLELVFENVPNMIFVKDAKTLKFLKFNRAGEDLLGFRSSELIGKSDFDFFPKEEAEFFTSKDKDIIASGNVLDIPEEFINTKNNGRRILHTKKIPVFDKDKNPLYIIGISEDITEKKTLIEKKERLEVALLSALRINKLIENSLEAVVAINEKGIISTWNSQAELVFGWKKNEAIGRVLADLIFPPKQREEYENGLAKFLKTGERAIINKREEIYCKKKNGEVFPIELTVTPIGDETGFTFYAFIRDITSLKTIKEKQLFLLGQEHLAREAAEQSLNMRDDFLSIAAHELKTPLTPLTLQLQVIEKILLNTKKQDLTQTRIDDILIMIQNSKLELNRFTKLIDVLLDVTRISAGRLVLNIKEVDLVALINNLLIRFEEIIKQTGSKIETNLPSKLIGEWDKVRIESVIENLLTNALKYGNGKPIIISLHQDEQAVFLTVEDHGIGISPSDQPKIFKRFERASSVTKYSGLGLGLYITHKIIEAHHGNISFESRINIGTKFSVRLPLHQSTMSQTPKFKVQ